MLSLYNTSCLHVRMLNARHKLSNFLRKSFQEKGGRCISNGLLMIVGAGVCEVGVVHVGIMSHLPAG